jgi:hypothetical protein
VDGGPFLPDRSAGAVGFVDDREVESGQGEAVGALVGGQDGAE